MSSLTRHLRAFAVLASLFFFSSCSEVSLVGFGQQQEHKKKNPVIQKSYSRQPLTRMELNQLLEMAVYTGAPEFYGDIILDGQSEQYGSAPVRFSHQIHRSRYTCNVCHIELEFSLRQGKTGVTREDNLEGRYCGACHNGKVAFTTEADCQKCHRKTDPTLNLSDAAALLSRPLLSTTSYGDRINWVKALQREEIAPEQALFAESEFPSMPLPDHLLQPLLWTTATPNLLVRFPHVEHVAWLDCSNCHPDLFSIKQTGTVTFDKESNLYGEFCGTCHMNVALPMNGCSRCHPGVKNHR